MLLDKLVINSANGVIRSIEFKKGLNLILDETTNVLTESGNNVGKTTLLRVIDYCFGSEGKDIYIDPEFKKINSYIYDNLVSQEYNFSLTLLDGQREITVVRFFSEKFLGFINGDKFEDKTLYRAEIKKQIFYATQTKPSLRDIMPKFIRKDIISMSNTLKFLHQATTKDTYYILHLFLFGFEDIEILNERHHKARKFKLLKKKYQTLTKGVSLNGLKQIIKVLDRDIADEEKKVKQYNISEAYESEMSTLRKLRQDIPQLLTETDNLNIRIQLSEKSIQELKNNKSQVNLKLLEEIYKEAKKFIPDLQKTFEDLYFFHNKMIDQKISFVNDQLSILQRRYTYRKKILDGKLADEENIIRNFKDTDTFTDLTVLNKKLNELYRRKGENESLYTYIQNISQELKETETDLEEIESKIKLYFQDFDQKITVFNKYFTQYSRDLYDEEFVLSYDPFDITCVNANVGTGKKKGQVGAFDLAYISFLSELNLWFPKFIFHDSIEDMHDNQIETLFNIADSIDGQYIVTILKNRLSFLKDSFIESHTRLVLSEKDKLFKIPD